MSLLPVPIGGERLHRKTFLDYQLNRQRSLGFADTAAFRRAAASIRDHADAPARLLPIADDALAQADLRTAIGALRVSEFFQPHGAPERAQTYARFRDAFDQLAGDACTRHRVPYGDHHLPAYTLPAVGPSHGTVVLHGGFDSLIEEFFAIWEHVAQAGYDVIAFEGPGQGAARYQGLLFDHDWERPVGAVLDHFGLQRAALVGISMGGYWALRAAAHEPRIDQVVAWPPVYDWLHQLPAFLRGPLRWVLQFRGLWNLNIRVRMRWVPVIDHAIRQANHLCGGTEPMDAVDWILGMNQAHIQSDRVRAHVLLLGGQDDTFQPPKLLRAQAAALPNAASVTQRMFTADEHAGAHCQLTNLPLVTHTLTHWLRTGALP